MSHLILSSFSHDARSAARELGVPDDFIQCREQGTARVLHAHTPYLLGSRMEPADWRVLTTLAPWSVAQPLTRLCTTCGCDTTLALAELIDDLQAMEPYSLSAAGAAASAFTSRIDRMRGAVGNYQSAMLQYWEAARWRTPDASGAALARQRMEQAGKALGQGFATELRASSRHMALGHRELLHRDGQTPLRVRKARNFAQLNVMSSFEASRLARLARCARPLGPGVMAFDFAWRAIDVRNEYRAGGDWERKAIVDGAGFTAGALGSSVVVWAGMGALPLAVAATPMGWVLIVGSLGVVAAATIAGVQVDRVVQGLASRYLDSRGSPTQRTP